MTMVGRRVVESALGVTGVLYLLGLGACSATSSTPVPPPVAQHAEEPPPLPPPAVYIDPKAPVESRVADLLSRMTQEEKARMLAGSGWMESAPIPRLGIPAIKMADGPMGVRNWIGSSAATNASPVHATAFPASIAMAATWDTELVEQQGHVIGQEVKALGRDMILGPTVNIQRSPLWGRNFEGYGEDPYLTARMGVAYIKGVQSEGVIATVKHFAANNQEYERHRIDESIGVRALNEIYFPAFKAAVQEAGVWSVMSAYNKVNGKWCAENPFLLSETLKKTWGFQGFVISDWGSTYSTAGTIEAGMDLEMPGGEPMALWSKKPEFAKEGRGAGWLTEDKVLAALREKRVSPGEVDENVRRILRVMLLAGLFDSPHHEGGLVDTPEQRAVARRAATEGMVVLKNDGAILPLSAGRKKIAILGPNAAVARTGGGGSSRVVPAYAVTPLDAIREHATVSYALGVGMEGEAPTAAADLDNAVRAAKQADVAVVFVGNASALESEGFDRKTMDLPAGQDALIEAVVKAKKETVVVVVAGAPVSMNRWAGRVPAIVYAWYGGQEEGHAIADVLFGQENPSGKVPVTFPERLEDSTAFANYPGVGLHVRYDEGVYVGYRGFDKRHAKPLFPFGHGLSYTTFEYSDISVSKPLVTMGDTVDVSVRVRNSGRRAGAEVVELYLHDQASSIDRPEKELKGFRRVVLEPGEAKVVTFTLDKAALSFYEPEKGWTAEPGRFDVLVGASSQDIRIRGSFELRDR